MAVAEEASPEEGEISTISGVALDLTPRVERDYKERNQKRKEKKIRTNGMRKTLSLTTLHNSFAKVGNAPIGIREGVGWNRRFVRTI
jgi:hypothetical protein